MSIEQPLRATADDEDKWSAERAGIDLSALPNPVSLIKVKIAEDGWQKGHYGDFTDGGPVCLVGAERSVFWSAGSHHARLGLNAAEGANHPIRRLARRCISRAIRRQMQAREIRTWLHSDPDHVYYNDRLAGGKQAVLDMLADAAQEWERTYRDV